MKVLEDLSKDVLKSSEIDKELFSQYNVKRGLRNQDHSGVLVGLTNVGDVVGYKKEDGKIVPAEGQLYYRGIELLDLARGFQNEGRHGYDEAAFLLLTGRLPQKTELQEFSDYMASLRELPSYFTKNIIIS